VKQGQNPGRIEQYWPVGRDHMKLIEIELLEKSNGFLIQSTMAVRGAGGEDWHS